MVNRANEDLVNNIGNLANRTVSMIHRYREGALPPPAPADVDAASLREAWASASATIGAALADFDEGGRRSDCNWQLAAKGIRYVEGVRPWELARSERAGDASTERLDGVLAGLIATCREIAYHLAPFLPAAADRVAEQCGRDANSVPEPRPVFPKLEVV